MKMINIGSCFIYLFLFKYLYVLFMKVMDLFDLELYFINNYWIIVFFIYF